MSYNQTVFVIRAVNRARWLAELAEVLDQANRITSHMNVAAGDEEVIALRARIIALRSNVDSFRRSRRFDCDEIGPKRIH